MMTIRRLLLQDLAEPVRLKLNQLSFFTSDGFCNLWRTLGGRPVCYLGQEGSEDLFALSAVEFGRLFWKRLQAMPDGTYGRIVKLADSVDSAQAGQLLLQKLHGAGYIKVHVYDFHMEFPRPAKWEVKDCQAHVVELTGPEWQPPDGKLRSEIRKAQRDGVQIRKYDDSIDRDAFHKLREATEARHGGKGRYPIEFYDALARLTREDDRVWWYVVEADRELAASHVYLRDGNMLLNWMVHFDKKFSYLKPNQLMTFTLAERGIENGVTRLNLGSTPIEVPTLAAYKEKWGGEIFRYPCYYFGRGGL